MKKGFVFNISLVIITTLVLMSIFVILQNKKDSLELNNLGQKQFDLITSYQAGEAIKFYVQQSSKYSLMQTVFDLGSNGGFADSGKCGSYLGYQLWKSDCFPDLDQELNKRFQLVLGEYLITYSRDIPLDYSSAIVQKAPLTVFAYSNSPATINIATKEIVSKQPGLLTRIVSSIISAPLPSPKVGMPPRVIPKGQQSLVSKVYDLYGSTIRLASLNYPQVKMSLMIGTIAQESAANPNAISWTGCAGLWQFCYGKATEYKPRIFEKLTPCACSGNACQTQPKCNPSNDDRFDTTKETKAAVEYYQSLLNIFSKYSDQTRFAIAAYNAGETAVSNAIKATGTSDPQWEDASSKLVASPDKISEVRNHVVKVTAYMQEFELIDQNLKQEAYDAKKKELQSVKTHDCCFCSPSCGALCQIYPIPSDQSCGFSALGSYGQSCDMNFCAVSPKSVSSYEFRPALSVTIDYNLTTYQQIQKALTGDTGLFKRLDDCGNTKKTAECMASELSATMQQDPTLKWGFDADCDTQPQMVFNKLVESYTICALSSDDNCVCESSMEMNKALIPDGSFDVTITSSGQSTTFISDNINGIVLPYTTSLYLKSQTGQGQLNQPVKYSVNYQKGILNKAALDYDNSVSILGNKLRFLKQGKTLTILDDERYTSDYSSLAHCTLTKTTYRLCVTKQKDGKPEQAIVFNQQTGKLESQPITYRFALKPSV